MVLGAPLAAEAQGAGKAYRVALILASSPVSEMVGPEPVTAIRESLSTLCVASVTWRART
jgi:hypothetical protein